MKQAFAECERAGDLLTPSDLMIPSVPSNMASRMISRPEFLALSSCVHKGNNEPFETNDLVSRPDIPIRAQSDGLLSARPIPN